MVHGQFERALESVARVDEHSIDFETLVKLKVLRANIWYARKKYNLASAGYRSVSQLSDLSKSNYLMVKALEAQSYFMAGKPNLVLSAVHDLLNNGEELSISSLSQGLSSVLALDTSCHTGEQLILAVKYDPSRQDVVDGLTHRFRGQCKK